MDSELLAVVFGLASAVCWGCGDFNGGVATRRGSVYGVVIASQAIGILLLGSVALLLAEPVPPSQNLLAGAVAGIGGAVGLVALYQGLALGRMGVVAPVAAVVSAALPVVVGAVIEGLPNTQQLIGFGLALVAVWLITRGHGAAGVRWLELVLPAVAGLGFGLFLIIIDQASGPAVLWPLVAARSTSLTLLIVVAAVLGHRALPERKNLGLIALVGIFDTGGNAFYALAAQLGRLDIAAILSSLYPASTVVLARVVLKEQLTPRQLVGIVIAVAAVFLLAF